MSKCQPRPEVNGPTDAVLLYMQRVLNAWSE